jgi:hypothetical protein
MRVAEVEDVIVKYRLRIEAELLQQIHYAVVPEAKIFAVVEDLVPIVPRDIEDIGFPPKLPQLS